MRRKRIALLTINPDDPAQERIMDGIFRQCQAYDYDVAVISPMVHVTHFFQDYLAGELNIYELVNFDLFDGVIVTPIPMQEEQNTFLTEQLLSRMKKECKAPVVSINLSFGDYEVVHSDEWTALETITEHLIERHQCLDVAVLTGPKDFDISQERIDAVAGTLAAHGLSLDKKQIYYGDFWYTSGETLGARMANHEVPIPQAVICASDHMAIGLVNALTEHGIRVPEDVIVTGNGGSKEAALNYPTITTYDADESYTGAEAVNILHKRMNPDAKVVEISHAGYENLCMGMTCGCTEDTLKIREKIRDYMYTSYYNTTKNQDTTETSLTTLLESYISEQLAATTDARSCLNKIYESTYLLKPYDCFYLCLKEDWQDSACDMESGYPENMNLVIYADMVKKKHGYVNHVFSGKGHEKNFATKEMLPAFSENSPYAIEEDLQIPQVFYFTPVHFGRKTIGYAVLQNNLNQRTRIGNVYRNYIRFISNALEMSRAKDYARMLSEHDQMTGLYNRRGLERILSERKNAYGDDGSYLAMMVDMNNLKFINDNYGHEVGDEGICMIGRALCAVALEDEIPVRAGGDEFYLIGYGDYHKEDGVTRQEALMRQLEEENDKKPLPVTIVAAAGTVVKEASCVESLDMVLDEADVAMYVDKRNKKRV